MAQAPINSVDKRQPEPLQRATPVALMPREPSTLRAWGLDSTPAPTPDDVVESRSEVKPLGVVCEPVN